MGDALRELRTPKSKLRRGFIVHVFSTANSKSFLIVTLTARMCFGSFIVNNIVFFFVSVEHIFVKSKLSLCLDIVSSRSRFFVYKIYKVKFDITNLDEENVCVFKK